MSTYEWLRQATAKIRFSPDREAVRRELAGHLEERVEAEKARGLPQREAEAAAAEEKQAAETAEGGEETGEDKSSEDDDQWQSIFNIFNRDN